MPQFGNKPAIAPRGDLASLNGSVSLSAVSMRQQVEKSLKVLRAETLLIAS
jgi:hypothetical protein